MKFALYTNSVSAHLLPLAHEIASRIGKENFWYIYTGENLQGGGQEVASISEHDIQIERLDKNNQSILEGCDVLLCGGLRPIELLERRSAQGLRSFYQSERWFKPIPLKIMGLKLLLPGRIRMMVPCYRKMAKRFVNLANNDSHFHVLAIGPWAKADFFALGIRKDKIEDWGYFVEPSKCFKEEPFNGSHSKDSVLRVLWLGRMLDWKCVDTIIRAVALANRHLREEKTESCIKRISLSIYGAGPEEKRLKKLASSFSDCFPFCDFHPPVSLSKARTLMHEHDIYVLASNEQEGWGATVSEALSEGMNCLGTYEAGASAALLPRNLLFHSGDNQALARLLLKNDITTMGLPSTYTPSGAADKILSLLG